MALRSLRVEMFWDGATRPAVSAPLGDFFGTAFGLSPAFENAYMADPEGRSYLLALPMPFRTGARVAITNDGEVTQPEIYWEVDWEHWKAPPNEDSRRASRPVSYSVQHRLMLRIIGKTYAKALNARSPEELIAKDFLSTTFLRSQQTSPYPNQGLINVGIPAVGRR